MRNFTKIAENVNVSGVIAALAAQPYLWNQHTLRTEHPGTAHAEVDDIWLRFNEVPEEGVEAIIDDREAVAYEGWFALPAAQDIVFDVMRHMRAARLGRVIITRLGPGKRILPHVDQGAPAEYYTRTQVCLSNYPGSFFRIGDESVVMRPGDVWVIDNRVEHEVINNSADDRIVMIVDVRCS